MVSETLERKGTDIDVKVVDCDVHLVPKTKDELFERMPEPWRSRMGARRANATGKSTYAQFAGGKRRDSYPPTGAPPGSEPDFVHSQLFDDAGVDFALVIPEVRYTVDPEVNAAWCHAMNSWLSDTWLDKWSGGGRLFGTIAVSHDNPAGAAKEIEEWAEHPQFKQVLISDVSERPLGFPQYEPVWEAASRHGLPVAMHFTGHGAGALGSTPVGRFQHHVDYHSIAYPLVYSAHLVSLLCSGVFDRYPDLRFVFVEGGFLWHRPIVARLARHWERFSGEVIAVDNPLNYVLKHVRFTSQPIEESDEVGHVARLMELADADRTLMFSSDYPHFDYDDPKRALPKGLSKEARGRIMSGNARELYNLPSTRPLPNTASDGSSL